MAERKLDFADAVRVVEGPTLTQEDDRFDYPEPRYQTYGWLGGRMVMFAWTPTAEGIRVISMRNCHDKETRRIAPRLG
nr:BrnT family toxin [Sphingomonas hominis]